MLNDPAFWYFVSFMLFGIAFGRPLLRLFNSLIMEKQQKFAQQQIDAQTMYQQSITDLSTTERYCADLKDQVDQIYKNAQDQIKYLESQMQQTLLNYQKQHDLMLQQRLQLFKHENEQKIQLENLDVIIAAVTHNLRSKMLSDTDTLIRSQLMNKL